MCVRLLSLWHASYGYRGRVAGKGKGKLERLMLIDMPRWCDMGDCPRVWGVDEACNSCQGSSRRGVVGCPAVSMSSGDVGGSRLSGVGVNRRTSRRRRGRCGGALAGLQQLPGPQYQRRRRQLQKVYWRGLRLGCLTGRSEGGHVSGCRTPGGRLLVGPDEQWCSGDDV